MQRVFLGWDWFSKSGALIDTEVGSVRFPRFGDSVPLTPSSLDISGCYYRVPDDKVIPANSKAHLGVELMLDNRNLPLTSNIVETDPFSNVYSDIWASRNIDVVKNGRFRTEVINAHNYPVKLEKGRVLGYAVFTSEEELNNFSVETEMFCHYGPDASSHEPPGSQSAKPPSSHSLTCEHSDPSSCSHSSTCEQPRPSDSQTDYGPFFFTGPQNDREPACDDEDDLEEMVCDPLPNQAQNPGEPEPCDPQDTPPPSSPQLPEIPIAKIPIGAKILKLDLSNISKKALPYKSVGH